MFRPFNGSKQEPDEANIDNLKNYQSEYIKMPQLAKTVAWGEAAAFARAIRDSKVDDEELLKIMK